ncbi:MAG: carboxylating nicotinate-nucleotide diphosphorylase [Chloroflexaceae bacterium]|nr:carboxylating nicotinate-nucleotide diphosphorylase [Chloroflexaceae bacterium]NJO06992.1 carboxylating nicotinate-nucleotide diphosphorylase [Chloroflexaceae bacterium]
MDIPQQMLEEIVHRALREDVGDGDRTTLALIPAEAQTTAHVVTREAAVVAGLPVLAAVYAAVDAAVRVTLHVAEGARVTAGATLATVQGSARSILTGERVALNLTQRMCGIATQTTRYVAAVGNHSTRILDTRKTTPGLRVLEKYAVRMGGGVNHRFGLYDAIMIKDNHLALLAAHGIGLAAAVQRAKASVGPLVCVEVEVETVEDARIAAEAGADLILLDNMPPALLREAVAAVGGRVPLEASGGITLETIPAVAATGVDFISVGALTHSARAVDLSMEFAAQ